MHVYSLRVALHPFHCNTSCAPPSKPPPPEPEHHNESFRCSCLVKYCDARLAGRDHSSAVREVSRLLKLAGHPWHYLASSPLPRPIHSPSQGSTLGRSVPSLPGANFDVPFNMLIILIISRIS